MNPRRIHIIVRKNNGKTTLMVDLVTEFKRQGYRVATIKHTHHDHELDTPGKDSHRHREAGACAVGILTNGMHAVFWPQTENPKLANKYDQFDALMQDCDLILVEGDSQADAAKIEVHRASLGQQPYAASDSSIAAVVSDDNLQLETAVWKRSDLITLAENIKRLANLY